MVSRFLPCALLVLLPLVLPTTAPAAEDAVPDLTVDPGSGSTGDLLKITGLDFEAEPHSRRLALKAAIGGKRTVVIELEIVKWTPELLTVKIPQVGNAQDLEYHVVLLDWTGRTLARARKPFSLETGVRAGPAPED